MSTEIRRLLLAEFDRAIDGDHDQIARWVRSRESELRELLGIDVRAEVRGLLDGWREAAETLKAADSTTDVARGLQLRVCVKQLEAALLAAPAEPPVLKSVRSLDDGKLLAQFYDYTYFEDVMRLLAVPAVQQEKVNAAALVTDSIRAATAGGARLVDVNVLAAQLAAKKTSLPIHGHSTCAADPDIVLWRDIEVALALLAAPAVPSPDADALLIRAVDQWMVHGHACPLPECATCDAGFNQIRLAYKVWTNSRHRAAPAVPASPQEENKDDQTLARGPSPSPDSGTGSPRSPHPDSSQRWQPIETAPKDADVLLLFAEGWGVQPGYWYQMDDDTSQHRWLCVETQGLTGGGMGDGPTHWMPLPQAPGAVFGRGLRGRSCRS